MEKCNVCEGTGIKPPENKAMQPVEETKGLCDCCSYYRELTNVKGHNVCQLCIDLY
jgi:hypothetical protein